MTPVWRPGRWWVAALVALNLWLHLPISDVFDGLARQYGFTEYDTATRAVFLVAGLASATWLWWPSRPRAPLRRAVTGLVAVIALAQALIVVNGIEAIHYPQYALMAWLLVRTGLGLERSWLTATALGALDEIWQWQTMPRAVPGYLDWNDVVLNAIGAGLGVVAVVRMRRVAAPEQTLPRLWVTSALAVAGLVALMTGPLVEQPFYRVTPGGRWFHLMSAFEAVAGMAVIWIITRDVASARTAQPSP